MSLDYLLGRSNIRNFQFTESLAVTVANMILDDPEIETILYAIKERDEPMHNNEMV